jgi:hypothetical protein
MRPRVLVRRRMPGRMVLAAVAVGLAVANLVLVGAPGARATFPGANGKIVFQSRPNVSGTTYDIFTVNLDGTAPTNITSSPETRDLYPDWQSLQRD